MHILKKLFCFALCATSVGALLAKCWGVMEMHTVGLWFTLPSTVLLIAMFIWSARPGDEEFHDALRIGFLGGLIGSLLYDIARVPFHLYGQRIFAPIACYGMWLLDAPQSSRVTDVTGWTYHFSNGITFGIMYALFARGRHWFWAVVWACALETGAIFCPFGRIFNIRANATAILIAYWGHVAYGIPLGLFVQRWTRTHDQLNALPRLHAYIVLTFLLALLVAPLVLPHNIERDARRVSQTLRVEGKTLNPDFVRLKVGRDADPVQRFVIFENPDKEPVTIKIPKLQKEFPLAPGEKASVNFPKNGIYQAFVVNPIRTQSSFIIAEPVEQE